MTDREKKKLYDVQYRNKNRDKRRDQNRAWQQENRERAALHSARWRAKNPEEVRKQTLCCYHRRKQEPQFHLARCLRNRIRKVLHGESKSAPSLALLDMKLSEFKIYLQGQFRPGMTWENYGRVWHLDHVRPCASFDLTDREQQRACFQWDNFQPLFVKENLQKGALCP